MGILFGPAIAGFYSLASRMRAVLPAGLISISDSTYSRAISTRRLTLIFGSLENRVIAGFTLGISGLIFINAAPLILLIYGPAYAQSAAYFRFFIIISLVIGVEYILNKLLIAWNEDKYIRTCVYISLLVQLILSVALYFTLQNYAIPAALLVSHLFLVFVFGKKVRSIKVSQ
jgi:O-antigen/teichoic acid export membrane protein